MQIQKDNDIIWAKYKEDRDIIRNLENEFKIKIPNLNPESIKKHPKCEYQIKRDGEDPENGPFYEDDEKKMSKRNSQKLILSVKPFTKERERIKII